MSWPTKDVFAITVDGAILINVLALEEDDPPELALRPGIFVGVLVTEAEHELVSERVYNALSEIASIISGRRRRARTDRT